MYTSKIHITLLPWERAVGPSLVPQCPGLRPGRETLPPSTKDIRIYHAYNPDKSIGMSSLSWFLISQCLFIYLTLLVNMDGAMIGLFTFHSSFKILAYCSYISKEVSDVWCINSFFLLLYTITGRGLPVSKKKSLLTDIMLWQMSDQKSIYFPFFGLLYTQS